MNDENVPLNVLRAKRNATIPNDSIKPSQSSYSPIRGPAKTPSKTPVKKCVKDMVRILQAGHDHAHDHLHAHQDGSQRAPDEASVAGVPRKRTSIGSREHAVATSAHSGSPAATVVTTVSNLTVQSAPLPAPSQTSKLTTASGTAVAYYHHILAYLHAHPHLTSYSFTESQISSLWLSQRRSTTDLRGPSQSGSAPSRSRDSHQHNHKHKKSQKQRSPSLGGRTSGPARLQRKPGLLFMLPRMLLPLRQYHRRVEVIARHWLTSLLTAIITTRIDPPALLLLLQNP
jgi:hypothetical protein